ncbi:MAG: hypothetical protein JSR77_13300 [Planctomycetes bacterium]|nr:hypothetical protein [Planctomycetota bacterium]
MAVGIRELFDVFERVVTLPPEQRESALRAACGSDERLYAQAKRLLESDRGELAELKRPDPVQRPRFTADSTTSLPIIAESPNPSAVSFCADASAPPPAVPDFWLARLIGSGGFGTVWLARNTLTKEWCAVKIIPASHDSEVRGIEDFIAGIRGSPYFMPVRHVGRVDSSIYVVMPKADDAAGLDFDPERYTPITLETRLCQGVVPAREAARIGADLAAALAIMHARHICHGDIKPANIMRFEGRWVIADYGLVSRLDGSARRGFSKDYVADGVDDKRLADLIALARTLYRLATGDSAAEIGSLVQDPQRLGTSAHARKLADALVRTHDQDSRRAIRSADALNAALQRAARPVWQRPVLSAAAALAITAAALSIRAGLNPAAPAAPEPNVRLALGAVKRDNSGRAVGIIDRSVSLGEAGATITEGEAVKLFTSISPVRWAAVVTCNPSGELAKREEFGPNARPAPGPGEFSFPVSKTGWDGLDAGPGRYGMLIVTSDTHPPSDDWFDRLKSAWSQSGASNWGTPGLPDAWLIRGRIRAADTRRSSIDAPALEHPLSAWVNAVRRAVDPAGTSPPDIQAVMFVARPKSASPGPAANGNPP